MFLYLHFEKAALKREIKWKMVAGIDQNELVLLKFSKEEAEKQLRWEHSKEFEYEGQMYDVVSKEIKGDTIYYRCWWDHEETALNKKLQELVAQTFDKDKDKQRTQKQLTNYFQSFFCSTLFEWQATVPEDLVEIYQTIVYEDNFSTIRLSPPTPPPQYS
ncbi:MAG TPA: hypothetical protein DC015_15730 [Aequorivita sp.]|jgi:hypothetical protein|nr:hypothetical protein [Aequorivita sp.]HBC05599.1 hypothetical protein [Aequorivita sp.]|tara:strand:- start:12295 stop:12774 length:480 start_codon:yes stop_codon:yes gene_type:complete